MREGGTFRRLGEAIAELRWRRARAVRSREAEIFRAFEASIGGSEGARARPVSIRRGVLRVEVASAARLHELAAFGSEACLARTNARLGAPLVRRIDFRLSPGAREGG